jgi:protease IV
MIWGMSLVVRSVINFRRLLRNALARLVRRPPEFVTIELSGSLPDFETRVGFLRRRLQRGPTPPTLEGLRARVDRILYDGRVRGVVFRVKDLAASWTALEEVRGEFVLLKEHGVRVVVHLLEADTASYYLACAADEILAVPLATVRPTGVRTRVNFLRDTLKSVGVRAEVVAVSPFKSAGDVFVRNDFSRESREQAERLLDRRYEELVAAMVSGRGLSSQEAGARIDGAPYSAREALEVGLIDGTAYEDELPQRLGVTGKGAKIEEWAASSRALRLPYLKRRRRRVGLVSLSGTIVRGRSRRMPFPLPFFGGEQAGSDSVVGALRVAERNRRVGAVLFHVDSRGGDALASDLIWREVERIRRRKPVIVLMGATAASGGYYVAAAADHVMAHRTTVTGSIGVILLRPVASELYERLRVNPVAMERGAHSGLMDPSREPTEDELRVLKGQLAFFYDEFKDRVQEGRRIEPGTLESIAAGRVWTGTEALEHTLVDELGGFRAAVTKACELGEVDGARDSTALASIAPPRSGRPVPADPVERAGEVFDEVGETIALVRRGGFWALSPYDLRDA